MRILCLLYLIVGLSISPSPSSFEAELNRIARDFYSSTLDDCDNLKRKADYLSDDIEEALEEEEDYSTYEIGQLRQLLKEAEALEDYIGAVGGCGNYIPSISDFDLANRRVRASLFEIQSGQFCVQLILVELENFKTVMAYNNSSSNYKVSHQWQVPGSMRSGNGEMGLSKYSVRRIQNFGVETSTPKFANVRCRPF